MREEAAHSNAIRLTPRTCDQYGPGRDTAEEAQQQQQGGRRHGRRKLICHAYRVRPARVRRRAAESDPDRLSPMWLCRGCLGRAGPRGRCVLRHPVWPATRRHLGAVEASQASAVLELTACMCSLRVCGPLIALQFNATTPGNICWQSDGTLPCRQPLNQSEDCLNLDVRMAMVIH